MRAIDIHNNLNFRAAIAPGPAITTNAPIVSAIIDRANYEGLELSIQTGAIAAGASFTLLVEDGNTPTLTDNAAVPAGQLIGTQAQAGFASANANSLFKIGYQGTNRYVRATLTPLANTSAFICAQWVLGSPHTAPTPNPPA